LFAVLDAPVAKADPIEFVETTGALSPWIPGLFQALNAFGEDSSVTEGLRDQLVELTRLRDRVVANGRCRPWLALWDPFAALIESLIAMTRTYLEAAVAPDPSAAERLQAVAQGHLDEASRQIHLVNIRLDWWGVDHTVQLPDSAVAAAAAAYDATGAQNLIDLDSRGMALYERISGRATGPTGIGAGLLVDLGLVDRALDEARVYRVANIAYSRVDPNRAKFTALLDDPGWRADLLQVRRVFYEAQVEAETLLRKLAGHRRLEAGAVLALGFKMTESVSKTLLGLVLAASSPAAPKRTADYDDVLAAAKKAGLGDALLGFDEHIRNAHAHVDFEVTDDGVLLGRNRAKPVRLNDEELVDVVLASLESCAALFGGLDCVISEEGHESGDDRLLDIPLSDRLAILLAVSGVHPEHPTVKADRLEVSGAAHGDLGINPLQVVTILAPSIPNEIRRVTVRLRRRGGTVLADVPLEPLRRFLQGDGLAKQIAFVEFLGRTTINGRLVFSQRHVRFMMATLVHGLLDAPLSEVEAVAPLMSVVARRLKDRDLAEALDAFVPMKQARLKGSPVSQATIKAYNRLATYVGTPPGPWNTGSGSSLAAA
jgi:hypothetical protein